jgi:putrescine---pyruvate transaminase
MEKADVAGNAAARGDELLAGCLKLKDQHDIVGDVRGKGLMVALELVSDRRTKNPIGKKVIGEVFERIYQEGVMVRVSGHNIILSPSLIVTGEDIARIVSAIDVGIATV